MDYLGKITLKTTNAQTNELQREIFNAAPKARHQVYKYAHKFLGENDTQTAWKVWKFMRENINYKKDHPGHQKIYLPSAFLHLRQGDCKSFATFAAAILGALYEKNLFQGLPGYRLTSYQSRTIPSHIFNVVRFPDGRQLLLDGCFYKFNTEKNPTFAKNVFLNLKK